MNKLLFVLACILFSCNTTKQDTRNVDKAAVRHPEILAKKARDMFPCVTSKGDTIYFSDSAAYMGALNELQDTSFHLYQRNDSLLRLIDSMQDDSMCYRLVELYSQIIANQKQDYAKLLENTKHIPPVIVTQKIHDTTLDLAALSDCEFYKNQAIENLSKQTTETNKWTGKAKTRFWWIVVLLGIVGTGLYFKVKKLFAPKIKK